MAALYLLIMSKLVALDNYFDARNPSSSLSRWTVAHLGTLALASQAAEACAMIYEKIFFTVLFFLFMKVMVNGIVCDNSDLFWHWNLMIWGIAGVFYHSTHNLALLSLVYGIREKS